MIKTKTIFYVLIMLMLISCMQPTTQKSAVADFEIGEKWTWKWKRTVEGEIQAEGEDQLEVVPYHETLGFWNGTDTVQISASLQTKQSDSPFRDWPLKVGKKWKYEHTWVNNEGTKGTISQDVEVVSFKETVVDAGKFMAYKIEYRGRIVNSRGFNGEMNDDWWYCPTLKKYIKHVNDDGHGRYVNELTNYYAPSSKIYP